MPPTGIKRPGVTTEQRIAIRRHASSHPHLRQNQLAAWFETTYSRKINQSTISDNPSIINPPTHQSSIHLSINHRPAHQRAVQNIHQTNRFLSPLHSMLKSLNLDQLNEIETISTCPPPPWEPCPFVAITYGTTRDQSLESIKRTVSQAPEAIIYTDAASTDGNLGAAAVIIDQDRQVQSSSAIGVGSSKHYSVHAAEMIAIHSGICLAAEQHLGNHAIKL